jgi:RNA polymerase sigma factor (sigma-70 family)
VARRQLARYVRRAKVERRALERLGMEIPAVDAEEAAEIERRAGLEQLREGIAAELSRLGSTGREALRLRIVEERPYEEVAELLGVSEQAARARVSRALRRLGDALEARPDAGALGPRTACPAPQEGGS